SLPYGVAAKRCHPRSIFTYGPDMKGIGVSTAASTTPAANRSTLFEMTGTTIPTFPTIVSTTGIMPIVAMSTAITGTNIATSTKTIGTITRNIDTPVVEAHRCCSRIHTDDKRISARPLSTRHDAVAWLSKSPGILTG